MRIQHRNGCQRHLVYQRHHHHHPFHQNHRSDRYRAMWLVKSSYSNRIRKRRAKEWPAKVFKRHQHLDGSLFNWRHQTGRWQSTVNGHHQLNPHNNAPTANIFEIFSQIPRTIPNCSRHTMTWMYKSSEHHQSNQ